MRLTGKGRRHRGAGSREGGVSRVAAPATLAVAVLAALSASCRVSLSPLQNRLGIGVESYVVFVADGEAGAGDLYAASASGGPAFPVTYTRADESAPALSPDGLMLAYRRTALSEPGRARVWVMNLLSGAEREIPAPASAGRIAWSADGSVLYVEGSGRIWSTPAPPARPAVAEVPDSARARADSAFWVLLGDPPVGRLMACEGGSGLCMPGGSGPPAVLAAQGRSPVRWGPDSVGYFLGDVFAFRPLGGGTVREVRWTRMPERPREATGFPGTPGREP